MSCLLSQFNCKPDTFSTQFHFRTPNSHLCRDLNWAVPSGLVTKDHTRQLLEIPTGERDYRVIIFEKNLRVSHLWSSVEEIEQDIMSGNFMFPSAKESRALFEKGELSQSQRRRRKKSLPDTSVVDDHAAAKSSTTEATFEQSPAGSVKKSKTKTSEAEGTLSVELPVERSAYSDPLFVREIADSLLLPVDRKRLVDIGFDKSVESLKPDCNPGKVQCGLGNVKHEPSKASGWFEGKKKEFTLKIDELGNENAGLRAKVELLDKRLADLEVEKTTAKAELETTLAQMKLLAIDATLHAQAELMEEFKTSQHSEWNLDYEIQLWKNKEAEIAMDANEANEEPATLGAQRSEDVKPAHGESSKCATEKVREDPKESEEFITALA